VRRHMRVRSASPTRNAKTVTLNGQTTVSRGGEKKRWCGQCAKHYEGVTNATQKKECDDCHITQASFGMLGEGTWRWCGDCAKGHPGALKVQLAREKAHELGAKGKARRSTCMPHARCLLPTPCRHLMLARPCTDGLFVCSAHNSGPSQSWATSMGPAPPPVGLCSICSGSGAANSAKTRLRRYKNQRLLNPFY
jgi:hypothetical protein